jgi:hypothetical protein
MARVSRALYQQVCDDPIPANALPDNRRTQGVDDPVTMQRQFDAYELRAAGVSMRDIGGILGVTRETLLADLGAEDARRVSMVAGFQDSKIAMSVARYEGVIRRAMNRLAAQEELHQQGVPGARRNAFLDEKVIIEAQERIDRVLGLLRMVPGESAPATTADTTVNVILATFTALPADVRLDLLQRARERKMKQVG